MSNTNEDFSTELAISHEVDEEYPEDEIVNAEDVEDVAEEEEEEVPMGKYHLDGSSNPSLKLKRGYVYYFDANDSSTNTHPLLLSTSSSGGNTNGEYTNGVTNSQTENGTLTFQVPSDAPSTLYYVCGNHSGMGGEITISD